jgi:TolB-like protein
MTYLLVIGGFLSYWFWGCSQIITPTSSNTSPPSIQGSSQSPGVAPVPSPLVLSILYFEDRTRLPQLAWLRKGLSDMLITDLSQAPEIQIVQRERLEEIVREQALQAGGRIDDKAAVRLGRLTGATVILLGSATLVGETLRLDAHLLSVERGTVFGATFVEGRTAELLSLEKQLAARLLTLLRLKQSVHLPAKPASEPNVLKATGAFYEGLDAADRGDIGKALEKFETAIGQDPKYAEAVKQYERTSRAVDRTTLWAPGAAPLLRERQQYRLGMRLADELVRETVVAEPQKENAEETRAGSKFSVVLRFDQQAVSRWLEEVRRMGGSAVEQNGGLIVRLEPSDVQAAFATALAIPRRLFLHVPSAAGRHVAVYSQLQHWQGEDWISLDQEGRVVLQLHRQMTKAIVLPEGVLDAASLPKQFQVSFDPVPREQAIIKVELVGINEERRDVILSPRPLRHFPRGEVPDESSWQFLDEARDQLEHEIKKLWNPPISEAVPRPGYLPSARRTVMVATSIAAGHLGSVFVVDSSGDPLSDSACLTAVSGVDLILGSLLAHLEKTANGAVRLRIHCHLVKDNPPL